MRPVDINNTSENFLDFLSLHILCRLMEGKSLTEIATDLGYSQPFISQKLKLLQQNLNIELVEREGRKIVLNNFGIILAKQARIVLSAIETGIKEINRQYEKNKSDFSLAVFPSGSLVLIPELLKVNVKEFESLRLSFSEHEPVDAVNLVATKEIDAAVIFTYTESDYELQQVILNKDLEVLDLWLEEIKVALPKNCAEQGAQKISLKQLSEREWIAGCSKCRKHLERITLKAGYSANIRHESENISSVLSLVAAGYGIALLPNLGAVGAKHLLDSVCVINLSPRQYRKVQLVYPKVNRDSSKIIAVIKALKNIDINANQLKKI